MEDFVSSVNVGSLSGCLAVVTSLYIPVAILIYQEFKEKPSFNEFAWDKTVLLQRVIKGWQILGSVILSSIATIFWEHNISWVKLLLLTIYAIGIAILVKNLVCLFKWFMSDKIGRVGRKNYRQEQKIKFLKELDPDNSLDVWSNLFSSIELENAFLKDYLKIFFNKFSEAKKDNHWQYELCLTNNMERLYYHGPDFQDEIIDFAFNAYTDNDDTKNDEAYIKRTIVRKLFSLLSMNGNRYCFSISRSFDKKLENITSDDQILNAVRDFSFDALNEVLSAYDKISERNNHYGFELFPVDKWNISTLPTSKDKKANAKAMGLFISYLEMLPMFVGLRNDKIDDKRATFLDEIVFGMLGQKYSRKMIRIVNLYFSQTFFSSYENEDIGHALIRNFIDNDYHFLFMDTSCSVASSFDPNEPEEQRLKRIMKKFKEEEKRRDDDTLKLLASVYRVLLNTKEIKKIDDAIANYDLKDKSYQYRTDIRIVESNFEDLKNTISKVIKYKNSIK